MTETVQTPVSLTPEAPAKQDLLVNDLAATCLLNLLWRLFRHGTPDHHGAFSLATSSVRPLPTDPGQWRRLRRQSKASRQGGA